MTRSKLTLGPRLTALTAVVVVLASAALKPHLSRPFSAGQVEASLGGGREHAQLGEETAQHAATLQALDLLRNAQAMLAIGSSDGVDEKLANAETALSGRTRLDVEAAREALANEDLFLARQYLAAALAERRPLR